MPSKFPGADNFGPGKSNRYVTKLGEMLVKRGGHRFYKEGPGPKWSAADRNATEAFQRAQGWVGSDADGLPGSKTWALLETGKGKDIPRTSKSGGGGASPVPGFGKGYMYGEKNSRYAAGFHTGQDYPAPTGTKVVAVRGGTIGKVGHSGAYGNHIVLRADNSRDYWYCHLSAVAVSTGQSVSPGEVIGKVGSTGNTTGPHLHFEDRPRGGRYGQVRNPLW